MYPPSDHDGQGPNHAMIDVAPDLDQVLAALPAGQQRLLRRFNRMLASEAAARGYISRASVHWSWHSHILDSLAAIPLLDVLLGEEAAPRIIDVGSGAGLPGIPLAIARPLWKLNLSEERRGKVRLLGRFVRDLQISNARPRMGEATRESGNFEVAVARALAAPQRALAICQREVHDRGIVVLYLTCAQLADWPECARPEPLGTSRYRLPGLKSGRVAIAFPGGPTSTSAPEGTTALIN